MKTLNLLIGDPAKTSDYFGVIGMQATYPEKKIFVRHAKQFLKKSYNTVANHFEKLHKKINFDMMIIEKNFDHDNVSKAFSHLPITYVSTTGNMTDEARRKGWAVDKPYMIKWMKTQFKLHTIQYPSFQSSDTKELLNQHNEMVGITQPSGHVSYKRKRNRHDDLFLSLLIGCNATRLWWDMQQ